MGKIFGYLKQAKDFVMTKFGAKEVDRVQAKVLDILGDAKMSLNKKQRTVSKFFFSSSGKFSVIYFWTTAFLAVIWLIIASKFAVMAYIIIQMIKTKTIDAAMLSTMFSDTLILGLLTFITSLIWMYNKSKKDDSKEG